MAESHCIASVEPGWGKTPNDVIAPGRKILGLHRVTTAKGSFPTRYIRLVDGSGDLSPRGRRVRRLIQAIKLRGATCENVPFNADLSRWIHAELAINGRAEDTFRYPVAGWSSLGPFLLDPGIGVTSPLYYRYKVGSGKGPSVLSILIRSSATVREKRSLTRTIRENSSFLCDVGGNAQFGYRA